MKENSMQELLKIVSRLHNEDNLYKYTDSYRKFHAHIHDVICI